MLGVWIGSRDLNIADSPDRNVPGNHREREKLFGVAVIQESRRPRSARTSFEVHEMFPGEEQ
jgi:hypothetical protein